MSDRGRGVALTPGVYSQVLDHQLVSETDVHVGVAACGQTHACSIASKTTTTTMWRVGQLREALRHLTMPRRRLAAVLVGSS